MILFLDHLLPCHEHPFFSSDSIYMKNISTLSAFTLLSLVRANVETHNEKPIEMTSNLENTSHLSTKNVVDGIHEYPSLFEDKLQYVVELQLGSDGEKTVQFNNLANDDFDDQIARSENIIDSDVKVLKSFTSSNIEYPVNFKRDDTTYTTGWNIYFTDVTVTADVTVTDVSTKTFESSVTITTTSKKSSSFSSSRTSRNSSSLRPSSHTSRKSSSTIPTSNSREPSFTIPTSTESSITSISSNTPDALPSVSTIDTSSRNEDIRLIGASNNSFGALLFSLYFLL